MPSSRKYFSNLDALRCFAALGVIAFHLSGAFPWPESQIARIFRVLITLDGSSGKIGVNFFFTLSGFLITYLMFEERAQTSSLDVKSFYLRRTLRIWPLYFLTLLVGFVAYPAWTGISQQYADWKLYALFLSNFSNMDGPWLGILGVQWSIAIEEQFYLVWPWVFIWLGNKKYFPFVCTGLMGAAFVFYLSGGSIFHTLTAMNELALGALLAWLSFYHLPNVSKFFQKIPKGIILLVYLAGAILAYADFRLSRAVPGFIAINDLLLSFFFGFVIMEQNFSPNSFFKFGTVGVFSWLGRISYGLYLLHMVGITAVLLLNEVIAMPLMVNIVLSLTLAIGLSAASYYGFERPFLALKEKFRK